MKFRNLLLVSGTLAATVCAGRTISSVKDWEDVATNRAEWSQAHSLGADLTLTSSSSKIKEFTGSLDGRGFSFDGIGSPINKATGARFVNLTRNGNGIADIAEDCEFERCTFSSHNSYAAGFVGRIVRSKFIHCVVSSSGCFTSHCQDCSIDQCSVGGSGCFAGISMNCTFEGCSKTSGPDGNFIGSSEGDVVKNCESRGGYFIETARGTEVTGHIGLLAKNAEECKISDCTVENAMLVGASIRSEYRNCSAKFSADEIQGMFRSLSSDLVEKCRVENGYFTWTAHDARFRFCENKSNVVFPEKSTVGGLYVGWDPAAGCVFEKCKLICDVTSDRYEFGGFVPSGTNCTFKWCSVEGSITGVGRVGGIAGTLKDSSLIKQCNVDIDITGGQGGGLASVMNVSTADLCVVSGRISCEQGQYVGGLVGDLNKGSGLLCCTSHIAVVGYEDVGGLAGFMRESDISTCAADGSVTGQHEVGGLVGSAYSSKIECSAAKGNVQAKALRESGVSNRRFGGLVGILNESTLFWTRAEGAVSGPSSASILGGLVGEAEESCQIKNSCALGNVTGGQYVGGFLAYADHPASSILVYNCYARGAATSLDGEDTTAAFVAMAGRQTSLSSPGDVVQLKNCYATGKVTAFKEVMGFDMSNSGGLSPVMSISGTTTGITGDTESCYYDKTTVGLSRSGLNNPKGDSAKATLAMKNKSTYVGWDFNSIWKIEKGDYPTLRFDEGCSCNCEAEPEPSDEPADDCKDAYLRVSQNPLHFLCDGGRADLNVVSSNPWSARKLSGDADCTLSALSGNGDATLTVSVSSNRTDAARSWSWQISSACATVTLEVRQEVCERPGPDCSCSIEVDALQVVFDSCESDSTRVGVTSSGPWSSKVTGGAGLLVTSAGSKGKSTAVFTVSENTSGKLREWDVTFTTRTDCGDTCSTTVHVTQGTCQLACRISVRPASRTVNANRHWGFVTVTANDFWTLDAKSVPRWVIPLLSAGTAGTWYVPYIVRAQPDCGDGTAVDPRRASLRFVNAQGCSDTFVLDQLGRDCCTFLGVFREGEEQYAFTTNCAAFSLPLEIRSSSAWTAVSESAWIRIAAEDHRTGLLTLGVSASPGGERMGTVRLTNVEGDERIFTVLQTPETLAIEPSRIFLPAGAGGTNIAISCSTNWTVSIPEDVRSWVSVSPDSGRGNGRVVLSVRPNADGDLRLAELTVAAGRIERELLVVQDTAATHLAITGPDSMRSDEVAENLCFMISPGCKAEQVSPTWSVSGPDGIRIGSDGTVTLDGTLLTQAVATVTARYAADGRTLVGSREIEILPKPGPGVWTSDVAAALAGAKGDGRLIVALASDYNSCSRCRAFEPVARNPEFLKWAHDNGVYLIAATRSGPCGESVTDEYFWTLARSLGHTGSVPLPSLAFALPKAPYQGLGLDTARVGNTIGTVEYDGTVTTLIEGVASYLPTSDAIAFEDEFAYAEKGEAFVLTVYGGNEEAAASAKLNVAYVTAKASDFDLKSAVVEGSKGVEQTNLKFPLTLSWAKGDTTPKTITIPTKAGKAKDAPKYLTWTLSDAVGLGLGEPAYCIGKIESGDDYVGDDVCVLPYVEGGEGGKVSGGKAVKPDKKGKYASVTLKATPDKGYWFAGWYDEEGEFASGDLSFKVTPTPYGETPLLAYSARFVRADTSFCGTYNGTARVNLRGMTIAKGAETDEDVFGDYPFTLTLSTAGKVSGSVTVGGKKVSFKGDACTFLEDGWAEFPVALDEKSWFGKANRERLWVALNADGSVSGRAESLEGDCSPVADAEFPVSAHKAVGKDAASLSKVAKFAGTYSVWIPDDEDGLTTFALTIDAKGKVKAAGRMRDGSALAYSGSLGGYDEYFSPDGWANAYVYLDFALTAKSLGSGSCGVSLWLAKSLLDDDNAACPASVHVTKYMRGDVSALHSDNGTVIEYAPGCWACGSDSYVIETEDETITLPIVSKNGVVTGLGKPKEKGYTVKFDNKTGVLEIKKGKEYSIYGLLTSDGLFATRINADGSRSDVWTNACEAEDPDEVAEHYYGYVDDMSSDTGNPWWGLTRGTLTIDVLKSGAIRGTVVTGFGTKRYYADGFSDVDEDGRSAILMAMGGETLEFSIWNDRGWDEMQVEGWLQDPDFGKANKLQVIAQRDAFISGPCGYAYDNLRYFSEVVGTWRLAASPRDDYEVPDSDGMRYPYSHDFDLADSDTPGTLQLVVKANGMVEVSGSFAGEKVAGTWPVMVWWCDDKSDCFYAPCHLKLANGREVFMGFDLRSSRESGEVMIMGEGWIRTF